jgi:hypothetical protein
MSMPSPITNIADGPLARAGHSFYRFYTIDVGGRIALVEDHECEGDKTALARGKDILHSSKHPKVEVWFRKARVGVLDRDFVS